MRATRQAVLRGLVIIAACAGLSLAPDVKSPNGHVVVEAPDPDGADDGPRLQQAIDAAAGSGGGVVQIRAGQYRLDIRDDIRALAPRAKVRIVGDGPDQTILRVRSGRSKYQAVFYPYKDTDDLTGFSLQDLTIDQDGDANEPELTNAPAQSAHAVLCVLAGSSIRIENCRFTRLTGKNTLIFNGAHVSDVWVTNNQFDKVGSTVGPHYDHSTIYTHANRVHVTGNTFCGRVAGGGAFGATTAIETHGSSHIVSGNIIDGYAQGMNITGVADASDDVLVSNNVISGVAIGLQLWSYLYGSNKSHAALTNVVVSGNTISIDRDRWIPVAGPGLIGAGVLANPGNDAPMERIRVDRNTIVFKPTTYSTLSDDQSGGVEFWLTNGSVSSRDLSITGNQISGAYGAGIRLSMSADAVVISENIVRSPGRGPGRFADAFRSSVIVSHSLKGLTIRGNQFIDDQPTARMKYGIYDSTMAGSFDLRVADNQLHTADESVPMFQNAGGGGSFVVSFLSQRHPVLPTYAVAAGSTITETAAGRVRVQVDAPSGTTWRSQAYGLDAPISGTWAAGDLVYNTSPTSGGSVGWVCILGGTPGVFKPFGLIAP